MNILLITTKNGKELAPALRHSEKAASNYANKMFEKHGENIKVEAYDENANRIMTWEA